MILINLCYCVIMKIAITGAKGVVGKAIIDHLDPAEFEIVSIDLPEHDVKDLDDLIKMTAGCDAIIHSAWVTSTDNFRIEDIDLANVQMILNVYKAAKANGSRLIMASSNHAQRHDMRDTDGKIRASIQPATPDSPYGAEKIFLEALGRYYSVTHDLEVICIRIGTVTEDDKPIPPSTPKDPSRYWSHADVGRLVTCCLNAETIPDNFQVVYGVSNQPVFDWTNPFGYVPQD